MEMTIDIRDHLSDEDLKEIAIDEFRASLRKHFDSEDNATRILSNLAYQMVYDAVDKIIPGYQDVLEKKVAHIINNMNYDHSIFNFDYLSGRPKSLGANIIQSTVNDNKDLIKQRVIESIQNKDYSEGAWCKFESLAEDFTSNIYDFVELIKTKNQ